MVELCLERRIRNRLLMRGFTEECFRLKNKKYE